MARQSSEASEADSMEEMNRTIIYTIIIGIIIVVLIIAALRIIGKGLA